MKSEIDPSFAKTPQIKILHVFSTFNVGGTEVRTCDLINNLGSQFHHTIRVLKKGTDAAQLIQNRDNVTIIEGNFPISFIKALIAARKESSEIKPDLIITYSRGAIEWVVSHSVLSRIPFIHAEDGFTVETPDHQKLSRLIFRKLFFRFSSKIVVPAMVLKNVALKSWLVPGKKIAYIPNSVDTNKFKPLSIRPEKSTCILGIIESLYPVKNHQRLLKIIAQIPFAIDLQLWIIGTGVDEESLKQFSSILEFLNA